MFLMNISICLNAAATECSFSLSIHCYSGEMKKWCQCLAGVDGWMDGWMVDDYDYDVYTAAVRNCSCPRKYIEKQGGKKFLF